MTDLSAPGVGEVHLWLVSLAAGDAELARFERLLSPDELLRARRLRDRQFRDRFVAGRASVRRILAGYLGREPGSLHLVTGEHGKPYMAADEGTAVLEFSVSHTGNLAALAVTTHCEVGIDIEQVRDDLPFRGMAQRYFSPLEREELFSLPQDEQRTAFYRCWTRKEAYLKACGTGFTRPSDSFSVSLLPGHPASLIADRFSANEPARWTIMDVEVETGYCTALAADGTITAVRHFSWQLAPT